MRPKVLAFGAVVLVAIVAAAGVYEFTRAPATSRRIAAETATAPPSVPDQRGQSSTALPNPLDNLKTEAPIAATTPTAATLPDKTAASITAASAIDTTAAATAATSSPAVAEVTLSLTFKEKSWVEVRDGSGTAIFLQTAAAGTTQTVNGAPPLDVVIGNAAGVGVTYRGQAVDFSQFTHANIAKFSLK